MDNNIELGLIYVQSFKNKEKIESSKTCGCFYCLNIFSSKEVVEWVDKGKTALCPKCGIDSVLPEMYANKETLAKMQDIYFVGFFNKQEKEK